MKQLQNDMDDEFQRQIITKNSSATLNWIDEPNKDKIFALRNFECDANIYINIKEVLSSGTNAPQQKIASFVKRISLLKQKIGQTQHTKAPIAHVIPKPISASPSPSSPIIPAQTLAPRKTIVNGMANAQASIVQTSAPPSMQILRNATIGTNGPKIVMASSVSIANASTSILSAPISTISTGQSALNGVPHTIVSSPALHATANVQQSTQVVSAPHTPNTQPVRCASNGPQLLDLPARVRLRNRAYSIHVAPAEYNVNQLNPLARRPSIGNKSPAPNQSAPVAATVVSVASVQQAFDHSYTRPTMPISSQNFYLQTMQRPTAPPYMTKVHAQDFAKSAPQTLKVLTPDDLNSRK